MASNIKKALALLIVLSLTMVSAPAVASEPKTIYVGGAGASVDNEGLTAEESIPTIQAAINLALPGDTVRVAAGTYQESITINKSISLLGPYDFIAPRPGVRTVAPAILSGAVNIASGVDGVTLSGFSIKRSGTSEEVGVDVGSNSENVSITYNDISGFNQGIRSKGNSLNFGTDMNVSYNYVHDLTPDAVYGSYAILLRNVQGVNVSNNIITDTITGLTGQQFRRGIALRGVQEADVTNNIVNFGSTTASAQATYAISMQQKLNDGGNGDDLSISDVVIRGNTLSGVIWGINLSELDTQASGIVVKENTIRKVYTGVHFRSFGQAGPPVVQELLVEKNDFSQVQNSEALVSSGILSAGVQIFSLDSSAPAVNEFDGVQVRGNLLPSGNVNVLGDINALNVGAIQNPALFSFWPTVINNLDASGNYWGGASGLATTGQRVNATSYIANFKNDPNKAGQPGFWPIIQYRAQTINFTLVRSLSATASTELSASASGGLVGFISTTVGVCTVDETTLTALKAGTCLITASQAGNSIFAEASITRSISITAAAATITGFNPLPMSIGSAPQPLSAGGVGAPVTFTTNSACSISVEDGVSSLTAQAVGTCVITASRAANEVYGPAVTMKSIAITKSSQETLTVANDNGPRIAKGATGITLGVGGGSGSGVVSYTVSGSGCSLNQATRVLSVSTRTRGVVNCSVTARKAGNNDFLPASSAPKVFSFGS